MMQALNKLMSKWVLIVVVSLVSLGFVFFGLSYYIHDRAVAQSAVATVNGKQILQHQLDRSFDLAKRSVMQQQGGASLTDQQTVQLKQYLLQSIIKNHVLNQAAVNAGVYVSPEEAQQVLLHDPGLQKDGQFDTQRLEQFVFSQGLTMQQFIAQFQRQLTVRQMQMALAQSALSTPLEMQQFYALTQQKRSGGYFILSQSHYLNKSKITSQDIQRYYQQHLSDFKTPEKVSLDYILLSPKNIQSQIKVSEQELQDYYQQNMVNYTVPKRWQVSKIAVKDQATMQKVQQGLKQGKSFAELANLYSETPSAPQWLSEAAVSPALSGFLSQLSVKQVSAPFKTSKGYAIVRLLGVSAAKVRGFSRVRTQVRKALMQQKLDTLLTQKSDQVSDLAYTNPNTLAPAAKALGVKLQRSIMFDRSSHLKGVLSDPKVIAAAFSSELLKQGVNSNPISLKDGSLIVLRVANHVPSTTQDLSRVSSQVRGLLRKQYASRLVALDAYKAQQSLQQGSKPRAVAARYQSSWQQLHRVGRSNKNVNSLILRSLFGAKSGAVTPVEMANGNYAVLVVSKIVNGSGAGLSKKRTIQSQQELQGLWANLLYNIYVSSAMKQAKIKVLSKSL